MGTTITFDEVLILARQLPVLDKVRLIEYIAPQIQHELRLNQSQPRKSLRGLWQGLDITAEEITALRHGNVAQLSP
jgi:hypothetical protein